MGHVGSLVMANRERSRTDEVILKEHQLCTFGRNKKGRSMQRRCKVRGCTVKPQHYCTCDPVKALCQPHYVSTLVFCFCLCCGFGCDYYSNYTCGGLFCRH